ncbi:hypothetical protein [Nitrosomonas ureae]|uniref:Uncharacterized protein n=1 Tax=Nitrosomonas ureae TaxID=44577 RepID=A0A286AM93_9PROT|nr:hypothetical protein [Nitrosomonas ureae]SOD22994.1 hypothetical protein SAMN06297164_3642 [Nitrosomonas ureae]
MPAHPKYAFLRLMRQNLFNSSDMDDANRRTDQKIADYDAAVLKEQMNFKPAILSGKSAVEPFILLYIFKISKF